MNRSFTYSANGNIVLFALSRNSKRLFHLYKNVESTGAVKEIKNMENNAANGSEQAGNRVTVCERTTQISSNGHVFYNPVQEFNRDLSIAVLNVFAQETLEKRNAAAAISNFSYEPSMKYENGISILEALSATGLRSIRYAKEVAGIKEIVANDLSTKAVESIRDNIRDNGVEHLVTANHANAMLLMYDSLKSSKRFDAIDLDPYGCPNQFLDGAMHGIANGGLLLVTATDMAVLAGSAPESCYAKYGSLPLRMKCCHEMALRILLRCIEGTANRHGKYIDPLLSVSVDFYVRVFVRVHVGPSKCKLSMTKQGLIFQCTGCDTHAVRALGAVKPHGSSGGLKYSIPSGLPVAAECEHCGHKQQIGGPIWSAPIHNTAFVQKVLDLVDNKLVMLGTRSRLQGVLSMVLEELPDVPLYYSVDKLCLILRLQSMPILKIRSALLHANYRVSFSHAYNKSLKTDAPMSVIWDILRCWAKIHPVNPERIIQGSVLKAILEKPITQQYNLVDLHADANPGSRKQSLKRFQINPAPYWGPGTRSTHMTEGGIPAKRELNQNKRKQKPKGSKPEQGEHTTKSPKLQLE